MGLRSKVCEVVVTLKEDQDLSYSDIISMCEEVDVPLTRTQLSAILCHQGKGVSLELVEKVISTLGGVLILKHFKDDY